MSTMILQIKLVRKHATAPVTAIGLLISGITCRDDQVANSSARSQTEASTDEALPTVCLIPSFESKRVPGMTTRRDDLVVVRYELGPVFPADDFISAARQHIESLGWIRLDHSPLEPVLSKNTYDQWFPIAPGQSVDVSFEAWWARNGELVRLYLGRRRNQTAPEKGEVRGDVGFFDAASVRKRFPHEGGVSAKKPPGEAPAAP